MDYAVKEVTASFKEKWEEEAIKSLSSGREQYIANLNIIDEGYGKGAVVLTGEFANMLEEGNPEWDMKPGFLNGPNAKEGKNGKYNTIPFSFGTPGTLEENFNGGVLPKEIHNIVKKKPVDSPLQKAELPKAYQEPKKSSARVADSKFKQYEHKSSIYEGVSRSQDKVTGQNSYKSFRRVSENSSMDSWIYPAKEGVELAEKALLNFDIPTETGKAIDRWMNLNR